MKTFRFLAFLTVVSLLLGSGVALAQEETTTTTAAPTTTLAVPEISPDAEVVIVDANTARYDQGGQVTLNVEFRGLSQDVDPSQITVLEDGVPVPPESFTVEAGARATVPSFVALVIDTSGSMDGEPMAAAKDAATAFVQQKNDDDFVAILRFDDEVAVVQDFTTSKASLEAAIESLEPRGGTALYDAVITGVDLFAEAGEGIRKNMVILSDGSDSEAGATLEDALAAVEASNVRTFGVALESADFQPDELATLVEAGGGLFLTTTDPEELSTLYSQIQSELNRVVIVRLTSDVHLPQDVSFAVQYQGLADEVVASVPGFVTTTTGAVVTTTFVPPPMETTVITYDFPVPTSTLMWLAVLGIGGATVLFLFILFGTENDGASRFTNRLAAYGRRGGLAEEKRPLLERIPLLNRFTAAAEEQVRKRGLLGAVNSTLEQANLPLSAGEAIAAGIGLSAVLGLLAGLFAGPITGVVVFLIAVVIVGGVLNFVGSREKRRFENQLPDTLTLLSTSLRAGYSLLQAIEAVAQEAPNPTAREFGRAIAEARLGRQVTEALDGITVRTQSKDFEWAVMAIEIQREVGGNLAEVLQTVADTMLARNRLRGEIKALTAEGRISAFVLGGLPFAIAGFLASSNPEYLMPLFQSLFGQVAIGVGLLLMAAGMLWLRKIVNIEV